MNKAMLVMPPIYKFFLRGHPKQSEWGWHRAVDLVEAINNILVLQGQPRMTPSEINACYPFAKLSQHQQCGHATCVVHCDGRFSGCSLGTNNWLQVMVEADMYLPAKIGLALIKAVKHPVVSSIQNLLAKVG